MGCPEVAGEAGRHRPGSTRPAGEREEWAEEKKGEELGDQRGEQGRRCRCCIELK